tara:strand:+ start:482 stop:772 length:291 start_codon:yes stop_codon:yes gene_type:complete
MENNTYNGYYNRATWNLMLWINNTEASYNHFRELYYHFDGMDKDDRENKIMREAYNLYDGRTPDGDLLKNVLWEEVRENMDEDNYDILKDLVDYVA